MGRFCGPDRGVLARQMTKAPLRGRCTSLFIYAQDYTDAFIFSVRGP
jgi:hypothetical protein